jgi:hypothetical protein
MLPILYKHIIRGNNDDGDDNYTIPVIIGTTGIMSKLFKNTRATYRERTKTRNCRKHPYWALHTCFGKY